MEGKNDKTPPKPVIPWIGGKTGLVKQLVKHAPKEYNNYIEPFGGDASLLLALKPTKKNYISLNDVNGDLVNMYQQIKNNPFYIIATLKLLQKKL